MVLFPIIGRELSVAARRRQTYWYRVVVVAIAAVTCISFIKSGGIQWNSRSGGSRILTVLTALEMFICLAAGVFTTADSISSEKRQGTLGLLFLTDLNGYDVVLGKMAGTALNAIYAFLATMPLMMIPIVLGGVTSSDVVMMLLVLSGALLLSISCGLFVSAISEAEGEAVLGTILLVSLITIGPLAVGDMVNYFCKTVPAAGNELTSLGGGIKILSPWAGLAMARGESPYYANELNEMRWLLVGTLQLLTAGFSACMLALAARAARFSWRMGWGRIELKARKPGAEKPAAHAHAEARRNRRIARVREHRRRLLRINPILWLVHRDPLRTTYVWSVVVMFVIVWGWGWLLSGKSWMQTDVCVAASFVWHGALKLLVAFEAPRQVSEDRRSGSMELLLSTPLRDGDLVGGYLRAMVRQFWWPMVTIMGLDLLLLLVSFVGNNGGNEADALWVLSGMGFFFFDAVCLALFGLWAGVNERSASRASIQVVIWILGMPWVLAWPLGRVIGSISWGIGFWVNPDAAYFLAMVVISLGVNIFCLSRTTTALSQQFRLRNTMQNSLRQG